MQLSSLSMAVSALHRAGGRPNLIINGTFGSASNWSVPAGWAVSGGVATATSASSSLLQGGAQGFTCVSGTTYDIEFDWTHTGGTLFVYIGGGTASTFTTSGHKVFTLVSGSDTVQGLSFFGGSVSGTLDNVILRAR
jgi:hypothetical protein